MRLRKLLASILAFCMILSTMGTAVFAEEIPADETAVAIDYDATAEAEAVDTVETVETAATDPVAKVGNTEYPTIDEAIANWTSGTTLTLLSDVTLSDVIKLSSTEYHILDLGTYTMTAASGKDAIQYVVNGRSSAGAALDIKADATNPGGITATGKTIVSHIKPSSGAPEKDRPITRFYGGVFNASYVVKQGSTNSWGFMTSGYTGASAPYFYFYGGEYNGTIYTNRSQNQFHGGTFNGSMQMSVDSSAYTMVAGGTFKNLSNSFGSTLNSDKFVIGTSKGANNGSVCIDENGYYVVTSTTPSNAEASVASNYNSNNYFYYSTVNTNGMYYENVYDALEGNKTGVVTVLTDELNLSDTAFKGTIVVPEGEEVTIVVAEGTTPAWTIKSAVENEEPNVAYKDTNGNELVKNESGAFEEPTPAYVATVNGVGYTDIQEAIKAAAPSGTVEVMTDVVVDEWVMFAEKLTIGNGNLITLNINGLTINGNGKTITVNSIESAGNGARLFYDAENLTINNLTFNQPEGLGGIGLKSGTINKVTINGGVYGVLPGNGDVTIKDSTFKTNGTSIYFEEERDNLVVIGNKFENDSDANVILLRGNVEFTNNTIISGRTVNVVSGSPVVTGNDFGDVRFKVYNDATATIEDNKINNLAFNDETATQSTFGENTLSEKAQAALDAVTPGPVEVTTYDELAELFTNAEKRKPVNVIMLNDITGTAKLQNGYKDGATGVVVQAGDVLDGNGYTLTIEGANGTYGCVIAMKGGTVKNLTVKGAFRGIFMPGANGDVIIDNCVIEDVVYTFNSDAGSKDYAVTITNTALNGWTSYTNAHKSVAFENCTFGEGRGYAFFRPYQATTFTGCEFSEDMAIDATKAEAGGLEFDDCTYAGAALSEETAVPLFSTGGTVVIDGETVEFKEYVPVAQIGDTKYETLADAVNAAKAGDTITMIDDATLAETVTLPAGITFNGNGKTINGVVWAEGDLTFVGYTKVSNFNAGYNKPTITIGEGACLELTGSDRMVIGHGCTFNIEGNITDAKTANTADLTPSLIIPGASFTGAGVTFNVKDAYIKTTASYCSSSKTASGTFDFNIENSIWEQFGKLAFESQSTAATVNFDLKDSVLTTTSHLVFGVSRGEIVIDNSNVNVGTSRQIENQSTMTIKNGSVVNGAVATSSNAKNPGTIIVEDATYAVTGEFSGSDLGTGTLIIKKGATVSVGSIVDKANIVIDATGMTAEETINFTANLSKFTGTVEVINNDALEAKIVDGKIVFVTKPVAKIGETTYATLEEAFKAATSGCTIEILSDVVFEGNWDDRNTGSKFTVPVTIDGNNKTIKIIGSLSDPNGPFLFKFEADATVNNLIIDISEVTNAKAVAISAKADITIDGCTFIGNGSSSRGVRFGEGARENIGEVDATIINSTFTNFSRGISDNENGQDAKTVTITGNTLNNANVYVSAHDTVTFTGNTVTGGYVDIRSYTADNTLDVTATGNTLTENTETNYNYIKAGGTINAQDDFVLPWDGVTISNLEELKKFRDAVNAGDSYAGKTVTLTANIDLEGENWVAIGSVTQEHGFMGNFDGQNHKIMNLTITNPALDSDGYAYAALFGVTEGIDKDNQNFIKNLTIENVTINTTGHIVAAAIAYPYYTIVENVKVCGDINITGGDYTAGVLAYTRRCVNASGLTISGNSGSTITGKNTVGGVISDIQMNGGLTADYSNFSVSGVTITGDKCVGGISGIISGQALNGATVQNVKLVCDDSRVGTVVGSLGGTSTITNVTVENVTGATSIVGAAYDGGAAVQAKIGNKYYATLADAIKAAKESDEITLLAPIVVAADETLTLNKNVTITYTSNVPGEDMITNRGNLVIDGATLVYTNTDTTAYEVTVSTISCEAGATLEVKSGTVQNDSANNGDKHIYAFAIDLLTNGSLGDVTATISGGKVISTNYMAIRQFNNGDACKNTLNVTDGYIYGAKRAIQVHLKNDAAYLTIEGGKIEAGEDGYALCLFPTNATNITVTGGQFVGTVYSGTNGFISGGTFDKEPYAAYAVEGYAFEKNADGTYGVVEAKLSGTGTEEDPYLINDIDDLKLFRDFVNAGNDYKGKFIKLTADIDLENAAWTPIGTNAAPFKGNFDGCSKTIKNLKIEGEGNQGFFGYATEAKINNLNLNNVDVKGTDCVGAILGQGYASTYIDNCHVSGSVKVEGLTNVGGIVGKYYARVTNSSVVGDSVDTSYVKGVYLEKDLEGDNIGGIMGHAGENNTHSGNTVKNITVSGTRKIGGLIGTTDRATDLSGCTVENVVIECTAEAGYANENAATTTLGGLVGNYYGGSVGGTITDCAVTSVAFNQGNATNVGAVVGGVRTAPEATEVEGVTASNIVVTDVTGTTNYYFMAKPVAQIGDTEYTDLQKAIDAATADDVVTLIDDVSLVEGLTVAKDAVVTLDLNGKTVSYTSDADDTDLLVNSGNLTVTDSSDSKDGALIFTYTGAANQKSTSTIVNKPGAVLNIEAGTVENATASDNGSYAYGIDSQTNGNLGNVEVNVSGGSVVSNYMAIRQCVNGKVCTNTLNVTGGDIYGAKRAINVQDLGYNGSADASKVNDMAILNIERGNISSEADGYAVCVYGMTNNLSITDGIYEGWIFDYGIYHGTVSDGFISGGTFTTDVSDYLAEGYTLVDNNDGTYGVVVAPEEDDILTKLLVIYNMDVRTDDEGKKYYPIHVYAGIDSLKYKEVGFKVTVTNTDKNVSSDLTLPTTVVYQSMLVTHPDGSVRSRKPSDLGSVCKYMFGKEILFTAGNWTNANTVIEVTPYAIDLNGKEIIGTTKVVTNEVIQEADPTKSLFREVK